MLFTKRIISPGRYYVPDEESGKVKPVHVSKSRIKEWVSKFEKMTGAGLKIPAPFRHDPKAVPIRFKGDQQDVDAYNNGGFWKELWQTEDGSLYGRLESKDRSASRKIGTTVTDVSALAKGVWHDGEEGTQYQDALTHIALVTHPIVKNQGDFTKEEAGELAAAHCFSAANLAQTEFAEAVAEGGTMVETPPDGSDAAMNVSASDATVDDAIMVLRDMGLALPEDTDASNFVERIISAAIAVKGAKDKESAEQKAETQAAQPKIQSPPGGLGMSQESDVQLSAEQQAVMNWATGQAKQTYTARLEALVNNGQVTPKYCQDVLVPKLSDLQLSFDAEGNPKSGSLDELLSALEPLPIGTSLTGATPSTIRGGGQKVRLTQNDQGFSIQMTEEPVPGHAETKKPAEFDGEIDPDRQEEVIKEQLTNSNRAHLLKVTD